ncbi:MAG: flagellar basal body P-ring formation chaperone FlgA [Alphaproteobacteria bacterium]
MRFFKILMLLGGLFMSSNAIAGNLPAGSSLFSQGKLKTDERANLPVQTINVSAKTKHNKINQTLLLKDRVRIDRDQVMLSDLFLNLPTSYDQVLFDAPQAGKTMRVSTRFIDELVTKQGLSWQALTRNNSVEIARAGQRVDQSILTSIIAQFIESHPNLKARSFEVSLNGSATDYYIPTNIALDGEIDDWRYDPELGRFQAQLYIPNQMNSVEKILLSGRLQPLIKIPMTARQIARGQIIHAGDIIYQEIMESNLSPNAITLAQDLVGKQAKVNIQMGKAVRSNQINEPLLIRRGDQILISLQTDSMQLIAQGRALENGALGELIQVQNMQSKTQIDAVVKGRGRAVVQALSSNQF